jgi:predicted ATPase
MGKTALAAEAAVDAKARGAVAVWGTCWEGDGAPGYWPWIQVVRALARDGGGGEAVLATLTGANEASDGVLGDEAAARFRTYDATAAYLRERSAVRPLVVVLDDLHWADISSLRLLLFLARQLHDGSALVIGTHRDAELMLGEHPARGLLAELAGQAGLLQLAGLTASEVGQLLNEVCGEQPPAALTATVHERTGNPFFVQQTARLLAAQGAPLDQALVTGVPRAVGDVLARRLARLPGEVVDLLAIAAVAGKRFAIAAVAGIAGLAADGAAVGAAPRRGGAAGA